MSLEEQAEKLDLKNAIITSVIASLGFVSALFWRDAIKGTIDVIVPQGEGLVYSYLVAVGTTLLAIVVIYVLIKLQNAEISRILHPKERVKK